VHTLVYRLSVTLAGFVLRRSVVTNGWPPNIDLDLVNCSTYGLITPSVFLQFWFKIIIVIIAAGLYYNIPA